MKGGLLILLYGAGGHSKVVLDILLLSGQEVVGVIDDNPELTGGEFCGIPVLGTSAQLEALRGRASCGIVAIGNNAVRIEKADLLSSFGFELVTAVHPQATISGRVVLEPGTVVMGGAVINADTRLGRCVIVNTGATVDHDCELAEGVHIAPGANLAGRVKVGVLALVGIGASVIENVRVGCRAVVGAGAAVIADVPDDALVAGVPARIVKLSTRKAGLR